MAKGSEKAGWGTVDQQRLRILMLVDADQKRKAECFARALSRKHDVTVMSDPKSNIGAWFVASRASRTIKPQIIHALGTLGYAAAAEPVALGLKVPWVASLSLADLEGQQRRRALRTARRCDAVMLESESGADVLRNVGLSRDLYVISTPEQFEDDPHFLQGVEVVYGRLLAKDDEHRE